MTEIKTEVVTNYDSMFPESEEKVVHIHQEYTKVKKKAYNTQRQCKDAWLDMKWPVHNTFDRREMVTSEIYSSPNFKGIHFADGSGKLMHYRTIEAIRTKNGLIISNSQCWSRGFAHCTPPRGSERDYSLPLTSINNVLGSGEIYNITRVIQDGRWREPSVVIFSDGHGVAIGYDETSKGRGEFMFLLDKEEVNQITEPEEAIELLKPIEVELKEDRDIIRQGEWYFIPCPDKDFSNKRIEKPLKNCRNGSGEIRRWNNGDEDMGNHIARDKVKTADGIYVRGTVRHLHNEHEMINLGDTWHKAVTQDEREVHSIESGGGTRVD